jgi:putative hydrolase of the HAD superfamily
MPSDVQLVCFDLGRVLVRICNDWRHACAVAGLAVPEAAFSPALSAALHDLVCRAEVGGLDIDAFCRESARLLGVRPSDVRALSDAYTRGPYAGATDLLGALRAAGFATACLSNTNDNHWRIMSRPEGEYAALFGRLNHRFASHRLHLRKPDDAIYAHVERATGVPGGGIVFFDDVPENVEAARRRGWRAYRIDPAPDDPLPQIRSHLRAAGVM